MRQFLKRNKEWIGGAAFFLVLAVVGYFFHGESKPVEEVAEIKSKIAARHEEEYRKRCEEYGVTPDNAAWPVCRAKMVEEVEIEEFEDRRAEDHANGF
jgi:hypothetical protein